MDNFQYNFSLIPVDPSLKKNKKVMKWLRDCEKIIKEYPIFKDSFRATTYLDLK